MHSDPVPPAVPRIRTHFLSQSEIQPIIFQLQERSNNLKIQNQPIRSSLIYGFLTQLYLTHLGELTPLLSMQAINKHHSTLLTVDISPSIIYHYLVLVHWIFHFKTNFSHYNRLNNDAYPYQILS